MSDTKPKRRWFRFSLRALFIIFTTLALLFGWLGRNLSLLNERDALLHNGQWQISYGSCDSDGISPKPMPLLWRLLAVEPLSTVVVGTKAPEDWYQRYVAAFPEANVRREVHGEFGEFWQHERPSESKDN
jgi:hypothetical protein